MLFHIKKTVSLLRKKYKHSNNILFSTLVVLLIIITSFAFAVVITKEIKDKYSRLQTPEVTIVTDRGEIKIRFRENSPKTVENFINLSSNGFYDGTRIHRIVPNLLIEMGDPTSRNEDRKPEWGKSGVSYYFPDEISNDDRMVRGVVAMANSGPDTNGSRFFILVADAFWLNGKYTIFGDVVSGMEIVDNISLEDVGVTGIPINDIKILSTKVN